MADSPPRSGAPGSASGDDLDAAQVIEDGSGPGAADAPPFGGARPWWSADSGDGTGPHGALGGTGPHVLPAQRDGSGPYPVPPYGTGPLATVNGTGGHPMVGGTGGHPIVGGSGAFPVVGTGGHPIVQGGTGAQPVIRDGTGPLPPVPGAPGPRRRRVPRLLLVVGVSAAAAVALMAGALAFRTVGGGAERDARTTADPASKKVISAGPAAGGLRKDALTAPQASAAYPFIAGAVEAGGLPVAEQGLAVYTEEPVRKVNVLFMGGTGQVGDPAAFLRKVRPTTFITGQGADPGDQGGKAVCGTFAVLAETHMYCAWATRDSYGVVASNHPTVNPQFPLLADVMRRIRKDVEKPK
ncbi:hypothetical protein [Actinomadura monticuli]|uniref:Uncharacterized protein n=1 Tax=Actinomadura monticuli TaxID=3097367 RepID=A0ABV4QPA7_9ACTN